MQINYFDIINNASTVMSKVPKAKTKSQNKKRENIGSSARAGDRE